MKTWEQLWSCLYLNPLKFKAVILDHQELQDVPTDVYNNWAFLFFISDFIKCLSKSLFNFDVSNKNALSLTFILCFQQADSEKNYLSKDPAQPPQFLKGKKGDSARILKAGVWALPHSPLCGITIPNMLPLPLDGILPLRSVCRIAEGTAGDELVTFHLPNSSFWLLCI